jgi:MFS family permease
MVVNGPIQGEDTSASPIFTFFLLTFIAFALVGALVASRQPTNLIGWLIAGTALWFTFGSAADEYAQRALFVAPGSLPGGLTAAWFARLTQGPILFDVFIFIFLLFPNGRPLSPRWSAFTWLVVVAAMAGLFLYGFTPGPLDNSAYTNFANPFGIPALAALGDPLGGLVFLLTPVSAMSLVLRFRRSTGEEREQIKWLASAGVFIALAFLTGPVIWSTPTLANTLLWPILFVLAVITLPVSIGIAILKYRLYEIDLIIRKTLTYSILTALLLAVYFGSVVVLQQILVRITGEQQNEIVTVVSTLAIAALFVPLRRRVQDVIDQRFYRRKYDAHQVLVRFAEIARDEIELEKLIDELLIVVSETMQPKSASLWLKKTDNRGRRTVG